MAVKQVQNFYKETVKTQWGAGTGNFYVTGITPTVAPSFLVMSPSDASKREILMYTAVGSDAGGNFVTVSNIAHRGLGGTTAQTHEIGEKIRMNLTAQNWQEVIDELATKYGPGVTVPAPLLPGDAVPKSYADGLTIAGSPDASTITKGISKTSVAPVSATNPIVVGDNDPRMLSQAENDAAQGTSGTPSNTNRFVTNDDSAVAATADKIVRRQANGQVTVPATPIAATDAVSKQYFEGFSEHVAGEAFTGGTSPQPAKLINDLVQPFVNGSWAFNQNPGTGNQTQIALRIIPRKNCSISKITMPYYWNSAGSETMIFDIQTNSGNSPSGTVITNGTTTALTLNTIGQQQIAYGNFIFATPPNLVAGTTYWVVLRGSISGFVSIPLYNSFNQYAGFDWKSFNGTWAQHGSGGIPSFELVPVSNGSESLWLCDANGNGPITSWDLFVTNTIAAGASASVFQISGVLNGFSGLTTGKDYYLSNTAGALTTNTDEGTFIGTAISATQINIQRNGQRGIIINYQLFQLGGTASNVKQFFPIVFQESGIFSGKLTSGVTAGANYVSSSATLGRSSADNTRPSSVAIATTASDFVGTSYYNTVNFSVAVKKGDRITMQTDSGVSQFGGGYGLLFTPM